MTETDIETGLAREAEEDSGVVACACGATAPKPPHDGRSWEPLWTEGWRWAGRSTKGLKSMPDVWVYSCPACPSVLPPPRRPKPAPL